MKSVWTISDWWWWLVDTIGGSTTLKLERWYWQAAMRVNHWKWRLRVQWMDIQRAYWRVIPDRVTLALFAIFGFCAAAAIFMVAMTWFGIWTLIC